MSIVVYCEKCDARQPNDWKAGDSCTTCGGMVREEVRCTWCVKLTPKGKFCKHCGSEVQPEKYFGAARILKSIGVDQMELGEKLRELPAPKLEQYQSKYNRHLAVVQRVVEDMQRLEKMVVIQGQQKYSLIEDELLNKIPFDDETLADREKYATQRIESDLGFLRRRGELTSKVNLQLAGAAYYRWQPQQLTESHQYISQQIFEHIVDEKSFHREEWALLLGHLHAFKNTFDWTPFRKNTTLKNGKSFLETLTSVLEPLLDIPYLQPYAAVALVHVLKQLDQTNYLAYRRYEFLAKEALDNTDNNLRLAAGFLFENESVIATVARQDSPAGTEALHWLLQKDSGIIADVVIGDSLSHAQFLAIESWIKNLNSEYDKALEHWHQRRFRLEEKQRERRSQLFNESAVSDYQSREEEEARERAALEEQKPQPPVSPEGLEVLSGYALNMIVDARDFKDAVEEDAEGTPLYLRILGFAVSYGILTQEQLNAIVSNSETYDRRDAVGVLLSVPSHYGLDYSQSYKYYFTASKAYEAYQEGFEHIESWLEPLRAGHYPARQALDKALKFVKDHYSYTSVKDDRTRNILLDVLHLLLEATNEVSYHTAAFVITQALDIRNYLLSEWYADAAIRYGFCCRSHYYISGSPEPRKFEIGDTFIEDFFERSWESFIQTYNRLASVGSRLAHGPADLVKNWIDYNPAALAGQLSANPDWALQTIDALKEGLLIQGTQGILHIRTEDGEYPLIEALALKKWDMADVALYYHRPGELHYHQPEGCLKRFYEWLTGNEGINYYSPAFEKYARHFFTFSADAKKIPAGMIPLWLSESAACNNDQKKKAFFEDQFSVLVPLGCNNPLATVLREGEAFQLTSDYIFEHIFNGFGEVVAYAKANFHYGLKSAANRFVLQALYHAKDELIDRSENEEELAELVTALSALALNQHEAKMYNDYWLSYLIEVIIAQRNGFTNRFGFLNVVWKLGGLHYSISEKIYDFVKENISECIERDPETGLNALYAYYEDYFFGNRIDAKWVIYVLQERTREIARAFEQHEELFIEKGRFMLEYITREIHIGDADQRRTLGELEKHFYAVIEQVSPAKMPRELIGGIREQINAMKISLHISSKLERWMEEHGFAVEDEVPVPEPSIQEEEVQLPDNIDYDPEEIHMDMMQLSTFMSTFQANKDQVETLINHLPYYKKDRTDNPMMLSILMMKQAEIKAFLAEDMSAAIALYQKLLEIILDPLCEPNGPFPGYGQMTALMMPQMLEGSMFAMQYIHSLETMASSGAYSASHQEVLVSLTEQLKSQQTIS
ncbi:zinc ribbon domain-containing protein [Fulvivirga ulvae]|uniref:zinc ribbon domain-containing protein n=1 Tax=Fulvivirga ulvae TaxID=2904245 RepID=UPI001F1D45C9|nr:zinc ribbon domain-containing protein [Fulvivirga ulvae]UII32848.1 zinc ribbon domain-containing protein [Fulvivirga ulvae]